MEFSVAETPFLTEVIHCKIKETLLIQELTPAFNVNVSSEKLMVY